MLVWTARRHERPLEEYLIDLVQDDVLVGAGGTGSAIALSLLDGGVAQLAVHDTDGAKREAPVTRLSGVHTGKVVPGTASPAGLDLVVNATPLGMPTDDPVRVEVAALERSAFVGAVITMPEITPLLHAAQTTGGGTQTGVGMFEKSIALMADVCLAV